jgi:hypothetical protein
VWGQADGKLKVGILRVGNQRKVGEKIWKLHNRDSKLNCENKSATLFQADSCVVSLAPCTHDGHSFATNLRYQEIWDRNRTVFNKKHPKTVRNNNI